MYFVDNNSCDYKTRRILAFDKILLGTLSWKNSTITHIVYCQLLKAKLVSAIIAKWPPGDRVVRHNKIQQDGAKVHIENNNPEFLRMLEEQGLNAQMITQPVNSHDTNLLDLGFSYSSI